jgi:hypothetical protein
MFKWSTDNSIKAGLKSGPGLVSVSPQTVINHSSNKNNKFVSLEPTENIPIARVDLQKLVKIEHRV